jgi:hypothetical protein
VKFQFLRLSRAAALCVSIAACGGGGGGGGGGGLGWPVSSGGGGNASTPTSLTLSGTAATGAAFSGATVTVKDQTGATVCTTQTDGQGLYSCTLPSATKAPLAITALREDQSLYSTTASSGGVANITPLTTVIVSRLSPGGQPANLAAAVQADADTVTEARLQQQTAALIAALKPVLDALGQSGLDPIAGRFSADGTGPDRVLDALSVSVRPDSGVTNIEITVKGSSPGIGSAPVSIIFRSSDPSVPALPSSITSNQLANIPSPTLLAGLSDRLNACYRLPLSQRVNAPNDTAAVTGSAANVIAPACRELFVGNDPAGYLNSGYGVGRDAANLGSFTTLFRPENTNRKWDRTNFEFFRDNGDLTFSYRATDVGDNVAFGTLTARRVGDTLKLVGDGHVYASSVRPVFAFRDMMNSPAFNAYTTGYAMPIRNRLVGGVSIFSKVIVTSPLNAPMTFVPQDGLSFMVVTKADGTPLLNNGINLRGIYQNPSTPGQLAVRESGIGLLDPQYTDQQISQLQDQSIWKFEFVHADPSVPNVIQYERTLTRAPTIGEIREQPMFDLTPAMRTQLIARTNANAGLVYPANSLNQPNVLEISATGNQDAWAVPSGALAPSVLTAYGFAQSGTRFNDSMALATTARRMTIDCSTETAGDTHCDSSIGKQYAEGTRVHYLAFEATNARGLGLTRFVLFYKQF